MSKHIYILFLFFSLSLFAQKDTLQLGDRYWEDQIYASVTYNRLFNQPEGIGSSGFSYGISVGYIKDIPFNKKGNWAMGIGLGYNYDKFNHLLNVGYLTDIGNHTLSSNKIALYNIEIPIQLRWRTSNAVTYSFWRIYAGLRLSYNIHNSFKFEIENKSFEESNIETYNKFQTGLELSVGYGKINFFMYYGLVPMYDASIENKKITTKIAKFGMIFYLL